MAEDKDGAKKHSAQLLENYRNRIGLLKVSHEYYQKDKIAKAVEGYGKYLNIISKFCFTTEDQLKPRLFDQKTQIAEILLISQVYWALAKAYDRNPNLKSECKRYLDQFVLFSLGYKHQFINSEMIRKFIKKGIAYNPKLFEMAYKRVMVESKKCYVASFCYSESHPVTESLRDFKKILLKSRAGIFLVEKYYRFSPPFVVFCENNPLIGTPIKLVTRPILKAISIVTRCFLA
ncbi:MAG: hypothetical protein KAG61_08870 [Bacteriovoracaceae bacterium]|nr:hypothetical protein [Bacteriovoracaceae bacterium]